MGPTVMELLSIVILVLNARLLQKIVWLAPVVDLVPIEPEQDNKILAADEKAIEEVLPKVEEPIPSEPTEYGLVS